MGTYRKERIVHTKEEGSIVDLTQWVEDCISSSGIGQGLVCVMARHTTAAVTIMENEPGLQGDTRRALERTFPKDAAYAHNASEGDGNGHAHIRSTVLGQSVTISFDKGRSDLGTWQSVVLIELDNHGRDRTVILQLTGE
jgi:secondary thiamine-phosphate synthase enzyme